MLLDDEHDRMMDVYLHMDSHMIIANNREENMEEIEQDDPDYREMGKWGFANDFFVPCATNVHRENEIFPWAGVEEDEKPEDERCFSLNLKKINDDGDEDLHHEYFCVIATDPDTGEPLDADDANISVSEWVDKINTACRDIREE